MPREGNRSVVYLLFIRVNNFARGLAKLSAGAVIYDYYSFSFVIDSQIN